MRLAWIDACSWPGGVVRGFLSARVFLSYILGLLLFLVRGTCACTSVAPKREAGGFFPSGLMMPLVRFIHWTS
jgi:hypothetical protein